MYVQTFMYAHMCACHCVYVHSYRSVSTVAELANSWSQCNVYSPLQGSSGTLDCVLTCLSKPSHERTEDDIEGLLDVLAMLPVSV